MVIFAFSCSSTEETEPKLNLVGTKWQAQDEVSTIIYGGVNFQVIEFIDSENIQFIQRRNNSVRRIRGGTYTINGNKVTATIDEMNNPLILENSGSVLISSMKFLSGEFIVFEKIQ